MLDGRMRSHESQSNGNHKCWNETKNSTKIFLYIDLNLFIIGNTRSYSVFVVVFQRNSTEISFWKIFHWTRSWKPIYVHFFSVCSTNNNKKSWWLRPRATKKNNNMIHIYLWQKWLWIICVWNEWVHEVEFNL